jgi:tRNA A-37 threonylcarbamoyl transferase component Bud32
MTLSERRSSHGRYQLLRSLGEGSFGRVFEARDTRTQQRVAIKELVQSSPSALARFKHEFRALQDIHHVNLAGLKELYELDGRWYIVMELITGVDLLGWVCPQRASEADTENAPHSFDETRLRKALLDIVLGLRALHQNGVLHRDLKPSNIRIDESGRAVLLDFGLVTSLDRETQSTAAMGIGTAAYTAPEQAAGEKVDRAADYYALGACLYEALTGGVPFEGQSQLQMLMLKQQQLPPSPASIVPTVPADLDALCMRLLARIPATRIGADEVLAILSENDPSALEATFPIPTMVSGGFAGREAELERFENAFEETQRGRLRLLLLEGECGVGKSALISEFLQRQRLEVLNLLILKGRCYDNEQVPYKAFDGCIDALAKTLKRLPRSDCERLLPQRAAVLAQLFPVLLEVPAVVEASTRELSADPTARRLEAFAALCELLVNLGKEQPIIIVIEDLQWADAESFRMLRSLLEDGQQPALLLVCTMRPRAELTAEVREQVLVMRDLSCTHSLSLHGLPRADARRLATGLLGAHAPERWLQEIVEESRGHPLFLTVLAQYATSHENALNHALTLEAALNARIATLPANARMLLELVALAGRPHKSTVFVSALGTSQGFDTLLKPLLAERLIRVGRLEELDCFHDRIRQVVIKLVAKSQLEVLHKKLAQALSSEPDVDASEYARHWDAAGLPERALAAYETAGAHALESLAFARAEHFFARALSLLGDARESLLGDARDERLRQNLVLRGHALARGGNSREAAEAYGAAANLAEGDERTRLRVAAAQHLLQGGHIAAGVESARSLLKELDLPLPARPGGALMQMAWDRTLLSLLGNKASASSRRPVLSRQRLELDVLWNLTLPLGWVDLLSGATLAMRYLRRALAIGDPTHLARAFAQRATLIAIQTPTRVAEIKQAMATAKGLSAQLGDPSLDAYLGFMEGSAALICYDLLTARRCLESAELFLQTRCHGEPWLTTNVRMTLACTWFQQGEYARVRERTRRWLNEAQERDDSFASAGLMGIGAGFLLPLMDDEPERAASNLERAVASLPHAPFSLVQMGELAAVAICHLYRGGAKLPGWLEKREQLQRGSFILGTGLGKERSALYRALAALAEAAHAKESERKAPLRSARKLADALAKLQSPIAPALALFVSAQVSLLERRPDKALVHAQHARVAFAQSGAHYVHAAAWLEGMLLGGERGQALQKSASEHYKNQGFRNPVRGILTWLPALAALAPPPTPADKRS